MASATGIPENPRVAIAAGELQDPHQAGYGEDEPLLGRAGDASQQEGRPLFWNLALGTSSPHYLQYPIPKLTSSQ